MSDKAGSSCWIREALIFFSLVTCLSWTGCGSPAPEANAKGSQPQVERFSPAGRGDQAWFRPEGFQGKTEG